MTPKKRSGAAISLVVLMCSCSSGGGDSAQSNATVVTISCTPAFIQKLGNSDCTASVEGQAAAPNTIEWSVNRGSIDAQGRFVAPATAGRVTITANHGPTSGTGTQNVVISGARSLVDLPDDESGHQIHVLYVVASDGDDNELDTDGTLALSVEAWNEWFAARTGDRRLRLDRSGGALDVSFVRLAHTIDELHDYGPNVRGRIEYELVARGFDASDKVYLVYFEGGDAETGGCGAGAWPPTRPGSVAVVFLQAIPPSGPPCSDHAFAANVGSPGFLEFTGLHEVIHVLGFAPSCGSSHTTAGHVVDSPGDIMYAGPAEWNPTSVDANGNDYFEANLNECIDLADSAFLDPVPAAQTAPPGWPYEALEPQSCSLELDGSLKSTPGEPTNIQFINATAETAIVYWIDETPQRQFRSLLQPYEGYLAVTRTNHPYVVTTATDVCLAVFFGTTNMGRAVVESP